MSHHNNIPKDEIYSLITRLSALVAKAGEDRDLIHDLLEDYHDEMAKLEKKYKNTLQQNVSEVGS
jgi:hypothetical protein